MRSRNVFNVIKLAGAYTAFCAGSGFATGQEVMQFFTSFGFKGLMAIAVAFILFSIIAAKAMSDGYAADVTESDFELWSRYGGSLVGKFLQYFTFFQFYGMFVVIVGGAGALLQQNFGISNITGRILLLVICFFAVNIRMDKFINAIGAIGSFIIVFVVAVGGISTFRAENTLQDAWLMLPTLQLTKSCSNWLLTGILYVGYTAIPLIPFLSKLSKEAGNRKTAVSAGILGSAFLCLCILAMNMAFLGNLDIIYKQEIPMLVLAKRINPVLAMLFTVSMTLGVFSISTSMLRMTCVKVFREGTSGYRALAGVLAAVAFVLSILPFSKLVSLFYPAFGWIGIFVMICMVVRLLGERMRKQL